MTRAEVGKNFLFFPGCVMSNDILITSETSTPLLILFDFRSTNASLTDSDSCDRFKKIIDASRKYTQRKRRETDNINIFLVNPRNRPHPHPERLFFFVWGRLAFLPTRLQLEKIRLLRGMEARSVICPRIITHRDISCVSSTVHQIRSIILCRRDLQVRGDNQCVILHHCWALLRALRYLLILKNNNNTCKDAFRFGNDRKREKNILSVFVTLSTHKNGKC